MRRENSRQVKEATPEEAAIFQRFTLQPIAFEDATLEEAVAQLIHAYRETAKKTGYAEQPLFIDLSQANKAQRLTLTTPAVAGAGQILQLIAGLTGNAVRGDLPRFQLTALGEELRPEAAARQEVGPEWPTRVLNLFGQPLPVDSPVTIAQVMEVLGLGDAIGHVTFSRSQLSWTGLSEADAAKLTAVSEVWVGPTQTKMDFSVVRGAESILDGGMQPVFRAGQFDQQMERLSELNGVEITQLPTITLRNGEAGKIEMIREIRGPDNAAENWTGTRLKSVSEPLGQGNQLSFDYEYRESGKEPVVIRGEFNLSDMDAGVAVSHLKDGTVVMVIPRPVLIDATGRSVVRGGSY